MPDTNVDSTAAAPDDKPASATQQADNLGDKTTDLVEARQADLDERIEAAEVEAGKDTSLFKLVVWGTASVLIVMAGLVYLMAWLLSAKGNPGDWPGNLEGGDWFDIARSTATTLAVLGVGGAAMVAYRRQKTTELTHLLEQKKHYTAIQAQRIAAQQAATAADQLKLDSQKYELDLERRNSEDQRDLRARFNTVIEQLANPQATIQNAGLYALAALADDWHTYGNTTERQVCIDMFCSHLRDSSRKHLELKALRDERATQVREGQQSDVSLFETAEQERASQSVASILDTARLVLGRQLKQVGPWSITYDPQPIVPILASDPSPKPRGTSKLPPVRLNLAQAHLPGVDLTLAKLPAVDLAGADLSGATFEGASLIRANLIGANLSGANLLSARLIGADLCDANLSHAKLNNAILQEADLVGANLVGAVFDDGMMFGVHLSGANLENGHLCRARLAGADLSSSNLIEADLSRADLEGADLNGADLSGAYLSRANLSRAYLLRANLARADLEDADLEGANLGFANLSYASLSGANLRRAILVDANLSGADLTGADLTDAVLTDADLSGAVGRTVF